MATPSKPKNPVAPARKQETPFVSVEAPGTLLVRFPALSEKEKEKEEVKTYDLTKAGCLAAGKDIAIAGYDSWMNSSSVDFPRDYAPRCRLDIRELMSEGCRREFEKKKVPQKILIRKIIEHCSASRFQGTLTEAEKKLFQGWVEEVKDEFKMK